MRRAFACACACACACAGGFAATGCIDPNLYGTARTIPPRTVSHTLAAESITAFTAWQRSQLGTRGRSSDGSILPPLYMLRIGASERIDFGVRVSQIALVGFDVKFNLYRSRTFDLALNPMTQWFTHVHVPVVLDFNLSDDVTIIATPGVAWTSTEIRAGFYIDAEPSYSPQHIETKGGPFARLGAGINWRVHRLFAVQPEVTLLRAMMPSQDAPYDSIYWLAYGIGFTIGPQPHFGNDDCEP